MVEREDGRGDIYIYIYIEREREREREREVGGEREFFVPLTYAFID